MQNDLKYSKISEICGMNGYFAGKKLKIIAPTAPINSTFSKNILPWLIQSNKLIFQKPTKLQCFI